MRRPYLLPVPNDNELEPTTLTEVIRLICLDALVPTRLEIPARAITGADIDVAIRKNIEKLVEIYLKESRLFKSR